MATVDQILKAASKARAAGDETAARALQNAATRVAQEQGQPSTMNMAPVEVDRSGVKDGYLRRYLARGDNDAEKEGRLQKLGFTPEMYQKDVEGTGYLLDRDKIPEKLKEEYNIQGKGLLSIEDKGLSRYDFGEFFSANRGALVGGAAASLAATGVGLLPAMAVAGAGSGAGYLLDEGVEYASGNQKESLEDLGGQAVVEVALGAGGELGGRALSKLFASLIKGPSGKIANEKRELSRKIIAEGGRPTIRQATDRPILGRLQAIYEGVFPNRAAAEQNANAVIESLKKIKSNDPSISNADYDAMLQGIKRDLSVMYGGFDDAIKTADDNLKTVIDKNLDELNTVYKRGLSNEKSSQAIAETLKTSKKIFDEDMTFAFSEANKLLGNAPIINMKPVYNTLKQEAAKNEALGLTESKIGQLLKKYAQNETNGNVSVEKANGLRTAINEAAYNDNILATTDQMIISRLGDKLKKAFQEAEAIAAEATNKAKNLKPGERLRSAQGGNFVTGSGLQQQLDGFVALRKAQRQYEKGIARFQNTAVQEFFSDASKKANFNPMGLINNKYGLFDRNQGKEIKQFLKSVVPSGQRAMNQVPNKIGDIIDNNIEIRTTTGEVKRLKDVVDQLPAEDPTKRFYQEKFQDLVRYQTNLNKLRGQGKDTRESVRQLLAGSYLEELVARNTRRGDVVDFAKLNQEILNLGDTAPALFGAEFKKVSSLVDDLASSNAKMTDADFARLRGRPVTEHIAQLQSLKDELAEFDKQPLVRKLQQSLANRDVDGLVRSVLKDDNGQAIQELSNLTGGPNSATMEAVRSAAMEKILLVAGSDSAENGVEFVEEVLTGKHFKAFDKQLNKYGKSSLTNLFGKETSDDLFELAQFSKNISNEPLKGLGGLVASSTVTGLSLFAIAMAPLKAATAAAGLKFMSYVLRTPGFLKIITRPTGVRSGKLTKPLPDEDYDKLGVLFEKANEFAAQSAAQGVNQAQQTAEILIDRAPERLEMMEQRTQARRKKMPSTERMINFARPDIALQQPTQRRAVSPSLLGGNPQTQAINAEIARRLQNVK